VQRLTAPPTAAVDRSVGPCTRRCRPTGPGWQRGISKSVAVYHTGPVWLVGKTAEGALLERSRHELTEVDECLPRRHWEAFVAHEGGHPMQRVSIAVLLLAWMTLAMGGMVWGGAGEQRWTQYWGQVQSITIDRCGQRPGFCEGTLVLTLRHGSKVRLAVRPGMWLTRGERLVLLEELRVGDQIHVQAFEVAGAGAE
jgi:hypothetical protein